MAVFNRNDDFNDIQHQINYVGSSLGWKMHGQKQDYNGCSRRGDGWSSPFYNWYCSRCNVEIEKPWVDPDDEEKHNRCTECKKYNDLCTRQERKAELQERMDELFKEEQTMKRQIKKWILFRRKYPLKLLFGVPLDEYDIWSDDDEYTDDEYDQYDYDMIEEDEKYLKQLEYNEREQWETTGIDIQAYIVNNWYVPIKIEGLKERAKKLWDKFKIINEQKKKAIGEKTLGNDEYKNGEFEKAIEYYTKAILYRTDYKPAYTNRALMYFKLKQYDKCILDCSMVIAMINIVNDDTMLKSNELFKGYLRRGNAYKLQNDFDKLKLAKEDLDLAIKIKPNDGAAKKILYEINMSLKQIKFREKLRDIDDEKSLNDFDYVFNLCIQFLTESTSDDNIHGFELENRDSDELLRRLYVFMCTDNKYCVRFADKNGIELTLKYLRKKFRVIKLISDSNEKKEKLATFIRPFSLLNVCCEKKVNFSELKKKKHLKLVRMVILFTMNYYNLMNENLQVQSMQFISVVMAMNDICDNISEKSGSKMMEYFVLFQKKTNPFKQNTNSIRHLFETFSSFFQCKYFRIYLFKQSSPYLYEIFLHSMIRYNTFIKKRSENDIKYSQIDYENLQYSISVLLDGLGLVFDSEICLAKTGYNDDEKQLKNELNNMIIHFVNNKNINQYMKLLTNYLKLTYEKYKISNTENNEKDIEKYLSQLIRIFNVFVQLSEPSYPKLMQHKLYEFSIHSEVVLMMLMCKDPYNYKRKRIRQMIKLLKYKILTFLDHISNNEMFDILYGCKEFDENKSNGNVKILPYFWCFLMDVFNEKYKEMTITPKLMEEYTMNKSRSIRTVYRWMSRCVQNDKSFIFEIIIKKYFGAMIEWLSYSDEQIMANTPLVITECLKYANKYSKKCKKCIVKALSVKKLKGILKLMALESHHVIQYNTMLLMANIIDFDAQTANICSAIGATGLLQSYKKNKKKLSGKAIKF